MLPGFRRDHLAAARLAAGMSTADLAAAVGTVRSQVSAWEAGRTERPRPLLMPRLATALGVDVMTLLDVDPADPPLAALRLAAGLSVRDASRAAGTSLMGYQRLEVGRSHAPPQDNLLAAVAAGLGVSLAQVQAAVRRSRADSSQSP